MCTQIHYTKLQKPSHTHNKAIVIVLVGFSASRGSALGGERFGSMMDRLIYLYIMSPYGQINVHDVCSLWVKSHRMASCEAIPSAASTGNDSTLWYEIEAICYLCTLFPFPKEKGAIECFVWRTGPLILLHQLKLSTRVRLYCLYATRMPVQFRH